MNIQTRKLMIGIRCTRGDDFDRIGLASGKRSEVLESETGGSELEVLVRALEQLQILAQQPQFVSLLMLDEHALVADHRAGGEQLKVQRDGGHVKVRRCVIQTPLGR